MQHEWDKYFDTDTEYWRKVQKIYQENEKYPKKIVSGRNLHHKFMRSFSKLEKTPIDNDYDNLVSLDFGSHFLVHYYLWKCAKKGYRSRCACAFTYMRKKMTKYIDDDTVEMMALDYAMIMKDANLIHSIVGSRTLNDPSHPWRNKTKEQLSASSKKAAEKTKLRPDYKDICYRRGASLRNKTYEEAYGEEKARVLSEKRTISNNLRWEKYYNDLERIISLLGDDDILVTLTPEETGYYKKKEIYTHDVVHYLYRSCRDHLDESLQALKNIVNLMIALTKADEDRRNKE